MLICFRSRASLNGFITALASRNSLRSKEPLTSALVRIAVRPPPLCCSLTRCRDALAHRGGRLAFLLGERTGALRVHLDDQVHPIQQWPRQLAEVAPLDLPRTDAVPRIRRRARTRVGGQHQLEASRVARHAVAAGQPNLTVLQGSSQRLHDTDADLGALVEE